MFSKRLHARLVALGLALAVIAPNVLAVSPDHHEFEATLYAPFRGQVQEARDFQLGFSFIDARDPSTVAWRVDLLSADGKQTIRSWYGEERLFQKLVEVNVPWSGRGQLERALATGFYQVRLTASAGDPVLVRTTAGNLEQRVDRVLQNAKDTVVQQWEVHVGTPPKVAMPTFRALPTSTGAAKSQGALGSLPYTVYFGNLHTQSNDSDGGGAIATCSGSQPAQSGAFGPNDGFVYARAHGLDFSAASEHNHYFDGSSGTNTAASASAAITRYANGVAASNTFNSANPGFLALYGMEWGVINNGGHLNILNATELFGWESNSSGQLFGSTFVAKSDYQTLYSTMLGKGFIGQFNHPASSGQFLIGGTAFAYNADGDQVMVLAEIQNSSAFSKNTTETETGRSTYESAFKTLLERGYHIAPATNQDNHCANWGMSWTNRTGVLIPNGSALSKTAFFDALKARRVFATSDKNSQLVLTANGHLMGERFSNTGALNLVANFANGLGRTVASAQILEGVPGRNGTVTTLVSAATATITPTVGTHFYYARLVQDDGKILWSAPVWVTQGSGGGNVAPTANYTFTTSNLIANFTDASSDSDGTIASRSWSFGDGTTSTATNPSRTYAAAGTYSVVLTVTDNGGLTNAITKSVTVTAPPSGNVLSNGVAKTGIAAAKGASVNFTMVVPAGASGLKFVMSGGTGDADMYVKFGSAPTDTVYDCRPFTTGNAETCTITTAQAGTYYVRLKAYAAFSGVSLTGSYSTVVAGPFFQNTTVFNIGDNTTINSPITVTGVAGKAPSTLKVSVNITHTYQGDLKVDLVAPDGILYNLHNRTGGGTDNVIKTVTLNASSEVANGTWKMRVNDNAGGDIGKLNSWSMQF